MGEEDEVFRRVENPLNASSFFILQDKEQQHNTTKMAPSITETDAIATPITHLKDTEILPSQPIQKRHEEYQYLDLIREILETGEHRPDRYF